jgi:ABC-type antimicrobial peptide transport system permease subunit
MIPRFKSVSFIAEADIRFDMDGWVILLFIAFTIFTGIVAGIIPASLLSRIKPLMLLNKIQNIRLFRHIGMRKVMLVFQFMISMVLITLVTINYRQMIYAVNINFGNNRSNIYNLDLQGQDYQEMMNKIKQVPGVEKISAISHLMGNYRDRADDVRLTKDKDPITVREYFTDENYTSLFNLPFVAGKNFVSNTGQKFETSLIVNESFVSQFKLGTPSEAIGKPVIVGDSTNLVISGVVKDFLFKPAEYALEPMMMRYNTSEWNILNISIASGNTMQTVAQIENIWKKADPVHPIQGRFYNQEVQSIFSDMKDAIWIIAFIAFIGIMISCLGLLGITIYTVQSKAKEISIRKVVGAGAMDITKLLSRNYVQVILIAVLIALPVAWFLGSIILNSMHQHIPLSAGLFIPGLFLIIILSAFTIGFQTIKAILSNPASNLRSE